MRNIFSSIVFGLGLLIILAHHSIVALSIIPKNPLSNYYQAFTDLYIGRLAPQGWCFFTPVPTHTHALSVRCSHDGVAWRPYAVPASTEISSHEKNRFGSGEKTLYLLVDLARDMAQDIGSTENRMRNFSRYYCSKERFAQVRLKRLNGAPFSKRTAALPINSESHIYTSQVFDNEVR